MKPEKMRSEAPDTEDLDVFLLTKPPFAPGLELCLKLAARSGNARIFLAGDGGLSLACRHSRPARMPGICLQRRYGSKRNND